MIQRNDRPMAFRHGCCYSCSGSSTLENTRPLRDAGADYRQVRGQELQPGNSVANCGADGTKRTANVGIPQRCHSLELIDQIERLQFFMKICASLPSLCRQSAASKRHIIDSTARENADAPWIKQVHMTRQSCLLIGEHFPPVPDLNNGPPRTTC